MSQRHLVRAAVYLILEQDNKILFIRRYNTGYRDGEYTLPAGHVEPNETFIQTAVREAKEEVCVDIAAEDLRLVHVMQRHEAGVDVVDYYFHISRWAGDPQIGEPHKADQLAWLGRDEFDGKAIHFVGKAIKHVDASILFSHDGLPVA